MPRSNRYLSTASLAAALWLTGTIVGCTSTPAAAPAAAEPPSRQASAAAALPPIELDGALMFQLMAAELAVQRGELASAYATFIGVARTTRDPRLARRATEVAIGARALPQALEAAQLWRELEPGSDEALQAMATLLVGGGRYDEALPLFAEQVRSAPATELARVQRVLSRAPDRAAAFALLEQLAQPYRDDPQVGADVRLTVAAGAFAAGRTDRALAEGRAALQLRPHDERAVLTVTQLLTQPVDGKVADPGRAQALDLLHGFVERNPKASEARLAYARLLVAENRLAAARVQFEQVLAGDPRNLDALYAAGILALDGPPPHEAARAHLQRYLQVLGESPQAQRAAEPAYLNLARIAEEERKYEEALQWLGRIDDGEQFIVARARTALVLGKMKRVDEALKLLAETPATTAEDRTQLALAEGQLLREAQRFRESFEVLDGALKLSPDNTALLYDAAMAAERLDRLDVMEQRLRQVIRLKPDDAHAFNALGYTFADRNVRLQEARELIVQALKLAPDDAYILDSKGWVLFRLGDLARAREYLQRAWQLRPHAEVGAHYGEVLWVTGEREQARRIWRRARDLEPDNETLRSTLKRLEVRL